MSRTKVSAQAMPAGLDLIRVAIDSEIARLIDTMERDGPSCKHPLIGRVYRWMRHYLESCGKRMHGIAVTLAYRACGGSSVKKIAPIAAAFQLYHHHTLVHDDIYDEDMCRRGWPTTHMAFADYLDDVPDASDGKCILFSNGKLRRGTITAFAYGKICRALAGSLITGAAFPESVRMDITRALEQHDLYDNAAQLQDIYHEGSSIPGPQVCLDNAWLKTGRLFEVCAYAGGRLAEASGAQISALKKWAGLSALAYQLQDDLEDLAPDSEKGQGRGVGTDLVRCKPTYLYSMAKTLADGQDRTILLNWQSGTKGMKMDEVISALHRSGSLEACRQKVDECVSQACASLETAVPPFPVSEKETMAEFSRYYISSAYWRRHISADENRATALLGRS